MDRRRTTNAVLNSVVHQYKLINYQTILQIQKLCNSDVTNMLTCLCVNFKQESQLSQCNAVCSKIMLSVKVIENYTI